MAEGGREAGGVAAPDVVLQAEGGVARHADEDIVTCQSLVITGGECVEN